MQALMYGELAAYWPLLSPVEDYREEAQLYRRALGEHARRPVRTLLELGSGGGNNAFFLKAHFELTLVDLSPGMLDVSRRLNPELPHHQGDMRSVRLGRRFDAVFIHDAITYMTSRDDLLRALVTAYEHCEPGGLVLVAPDETTESFTAGTESGGTDSTHPEGGVRGLRYLEWVWDPDPTDETIVADYAFLLRDEHGQTRALHERHVHGLFPERAWLDALDAAGLEASTQSYEHSELERGYQLFIGQKPR